MNFSKLMIFMQQIQYNASIRTYVFQNLSGGDPYPILVLLSRTGLPPSKVLAARLVPQIEDGDAQAGIAICTFPSNKQQPHPVGI